MRIPSLLVMLVLFFLRLIRGLVKEGEHIDEGSHGLWYTLCALGIAFSIMALSSGVFAIPAAVTYILVFPWATTRYALIPLGLFRAAYHLTRLAEWVWGKDARGGAAVASAWALVRRGGHDARRVAWVQARIAGAERVGGAQILAAGLLCAARRDTVGARALIESVESLDHKVTPSMARRLANEWLVADAAERGAWSRVHALATGSAPQTRMTRLLGGVAARLARLDDAPGDNRLSLLWMAAPARRATRPIVRAAFATRRARDDAPVEAAPDVDAAGAFRDHHADALHAHVAALSAAPSSRTAAQLIALGRAWDRALLAPDTRTAVLTRGAALGARDAGGALAELRDTVARDLAFMANAAHLPVADISGDSAILIDAARLVRDDLMSEIDFAFDALGRRVDDARALPALEEWREWLGLRDLHERTAALGGLELRRLAFPHVHSNVCSFAVWLWNERGEHVIANAMFRWLLAEAVAVGDAEAIELQGNNCKLEP